MSQTLIVRRTLNIAEDIYHEEGYSVYYLARRVIQCTLWSYRKISVIFSPLLMTNFQLIFIKHTSHLLHHEAIRDRADSFLVNSWNRKYIPWCNTVHDSSTSETQDPDEWPTESGIYDCNMRVFIILIDTCLWKIKKKTSIECHRWQKWTKWNMRVRSYLSVTTDQWCSCANSHRLINNDI